MRLRLSRGSSLSCASCRVQLLARMSDSKKRAMTSSRLRGQSRAADRAGCACGCAGRGRGRGRGRVPTGRGRGQSNEADAAEESNVEDSEAIDSEHEEGIVEDAGCATTRTA
eukprot:6212945-Pleurochrysis_carterae.AAC.3